ncbi:MAG: SAM-dependent methyltransferase [Polyangiaceae bacterium]
MIDEVLERAKRVRPPGWVAKGPQPRGSGNDPSLLPHEDEDHSFLCGDFRIFQKKRGHRWSLDDAVTAMIALEVAEESAAQGAPVRHYLDMGCGIGSVLTMVLWGLPETKGVGIEAQDVSYAMASRSIRYNGIDVRTKLVFGDLREEHDAASALAPFDLVTGTPPYLPLGQGIVSDKPQRGPCCFETRGGIAEYAEAAKRYLSPTGHFVVCAGARPEGRAEAALHESGLHLQRVIDVVPREGKETLLHVFVCTLHGASGTRRSRFLVRDKTGSLTEDSRKLRDVLGMPPARS